MVLFNLNVAKTINEFSNSIIGDMIKKCTKPLPLNNDNSTDVMVEDVPQAYEQYVGLTYYEIRAQLAMTILTNLRSENLLYGDEINKISSLVSLTNFLVLKGARVWMPTLNGNAPRKRRPCMYKPAIRIATELHEYINVRTGYSCDILKQTILATAPKHVGIQDICELYSTCANIINLRGNIPDNKKVVAMWAAYEYLNLSLGPVQLY